MVNAYDWPKSRIVYLFGKFYLAHKKYLTKKYTKYINAFKSANMK